MPFDSDNEGPFMGSPLRMPETRIWKTRGRYDNGPELQATRVRVDVRAPNLQRLTEAAEKRHTLSF